MSTTPTPLRYVVGLDVAKADVQACLSRLDDQQHVTIRATRKFGNDAHGHAALQAWVGQHPRLAPICTRCGSVFCPPARTDL